MSCVLNVYNKRSKKQFAKLKFYVGFSGKLILINLIKYCEINTDG